MRSTKERSGLKRWLGKADYVRAIDRAIDYFGERRRPRVARRAGAPGFAVVVAHAVVRVRI
jgi:hypothetical protein